jgi:hopanoid biosynthesis associated radical SAM protein HpnH
MRFPLSLYLTLASSFVQSAFRGIKKLPLVLMLEPTHRCNLACVGCDRIRLYNKERTEDLSLSQCIDAATESNAPVVTITGGEPMLYPEVQHLVAELIRLKRYIYFCTNGTLTESFIEEFKPHRRLTLNFHLDGMEEIHDSMTNRPGTFKKAIETIKKAKKKGFRVSTNTSLYKNSKLKELENLFGLLKNIGVDGILISPAFSYERVEDNIFLSRDEIKEKFRHMENFFDKFPFMSSPLYVDFLKGKRQMRCTPWGNPTRNPLGWKSPCYLITDAYYGSFQELMEKTPWYRYESGVDDRCKNCMVHSGYEVTAMRTAFSNPRDLFRLALWNLKKP